MKNKNPSFRYYNNGVKTIKVKTGEEPPDGFVIGKKDKPIPWNKGLTKETDERVNRYVEESHKTRLSNNSYMPWNKGLTKETDDRILNYSVKLSGENNPMYGAHPIAWNKGLTKETDNRVNKISVSNRHKLVWNKGLHTKGHQQSLETREKIRKAHLNKDFKEQRYLIMKKNNTLFVRNSFAEKDVYNDLLKKYPVDDVELQYFDKERYPFKCDFYIKSEDKFIEVHGNWTHGGKPFDENDSECIKQLNIWKEKAKTSKYYQNAIYTWTDLDVRKRKIAKENNLNIEIIYYKYH